MKQIRKVIGLNMGHDGGCAICIDGNIVAIMTEERMTRKKHTSGWLYSLKYCLEKTNLKLNDFDLVVFSYYHDTLPKEFDGELHRFGFDKKKCVVVDHHLSHACSVFFTSPFQESLIFVFDAKGNNEDSESFYLAKGNQIEKIGGNPIRNAAKGIVSAYQAFTGYFGWDQNDAGKTMGLAAYGDDGKFSVKIFSKDANEMYYNKLPNHTACGLKKFCKKNNIKIPKNFNKKNPLIYKDMAAWIQYEFERSVIGSVKKFQKLTKSENLCLSGGGALNTVCNTKIVKNTDIKNLHIFPAAGDSGQGAGNALYGYYILGKNKRDSLYEWKSDYRSFKYTNKEVLTALERTLKVSNLLVPNSSKFTYEKIDNPEKLAAKLISKKNIIGWFQGGSEVGPRALGHRSILCDPRGKTIKNKLNDKVKHRELFRPFACSVLAEKSKDCFDLKINSPFMMFVSKIKENKKSKIPAVTHIDGTCRIQTITKEFNGIYYDLVKEFYNLTKVPLVLNTSFNLAGEPIVETPFDAIKCFLSTKMDYLIINDYLIKKI